MAMRQIDTRIWKDNWIRKINALDRYVFIYLLTNDNCSWCGIYELPLSVMAFETGIDERDLENSILPKLHPKVMYIDGWVYVSNFIKYHDTGSPGSRKGVLSAIKLVPDDILAKIREKADSPGLFRTVQDCPRSSSSSSSSSSSLYIGKKIEIFFTILFNNKLITTKQMEELIYEPCDDSGISITEFKKKQARQKKSVIQQLIDQGVSVDKLHEIILNSTNRPSHIIGMFWERKDAQFEDVHQIYEDFQRNIKPANILKSYSDEKILKTFDYLDDQDYLSDWTLETVIKKISRIDTLINKETTTNHDFSK